MYAIIATGGKQYRVKVGQTLRIETLPAEVGETVNFDKVLFVSEGAKIGAPYVDGANVEAEVVAHGRGPKITIIKFKRRKKYRRKQGHRQDFIEVKIKAIAA